MPKVTYIESNGAKHSIEIRRGWNLMQGATLNGITGIDGECGGACACATCHIYVDETFLARLEPPSADEQEMLEFTTSPREFNSRLGCQIEMEDSIDGIVVRLPERQS
tara:strand:+ start:1208 stop:1531 length:324 start_codon:yes stop_codon:yes gene_type:complete